MSPLLFCVALATAAEQTELDAPGAVVPDRHWDVEHLDLSVDLDIAGARVSGTTVHRLRPIGARHATLRMHQVGLDIQAITVDGVAVTDHRIGRNTLDIPMPPEGDIHEVRIDYAATPQTGLHFRGQHGSSDRIREVWSQGEDEDNRHWFPSWDYPNDKFTVTTSVRAPSDMMAFANGALVGTETDGDATVWTYALERPVVNYLVAVAVGEYRDVVVDGSVPLSFIGPQSMSERQVRNGLDEAAPQMAYFEELIGHPYPFEVYRQVLVGRFLYGGMENSSITLLSDKLALQDDNARRTRTEEVVAHELAHQWFGDLLTCYGWRELWLNEGFATFYTGRWMEQKRGSAYYAHKVDGWMRGGLRARTPMSPRGWSAVDGRDNEAVYVRGAATLHMLRVYLGDEIFDRAIRTYVAENADGLVETDDLRRVMETASGTHLGWFFDQWVHGVGAPTVKTTWNWREGVLTVKLNQTTEDTVFHAPVHIEVGVPGAPVMKEAWLGEGETRLVMDLASAPEWVAVNADASTMAHWDHTQEPAAWAAQAQHSPSPFAQLLALKKLGQAPASAEAVPALVLALKDDDLELEFRKLAARGLGKLKTPDAMTALMAVAKRTERPALREAVVRALGNGANDDGLTGELVRIAGSDSDPRTRAAAVEAVASRAPKRGAALARQMLNKPESTWGFPVREASLDVLGSHGVSSDYRAVLNYTKPKYTRVIRRSAAYAALAILDRQDDEWSDNHTSQLTDMLLPMLEDPDLRTRQAAIHFLGTTGDPGAIAGLERFAATNEVPGVSESALDAAARIRNKATDETPTSDKDMERLQEQLTALEERLETLESWR